MASVLLIVAVIGGCLLMLWASSKIEPHWVSKDGERLICYGQGISHTGQSSGRWRELRISRVRDNMVEVRPRRGSLAADRASGPPIRFGSSLMPRKHVRKTTYWKVVGRTESTQKNKVMYVLNGSNDPTLPEMLAIRLPANSKAIPMFESLATKPTSTASPPSSRTPRPADQPDPD